MIFPILGGLISIRKAPITWLLVFLNLTLLVYTSLSGRSSQSGLDQIMQDEFFVKTQGRVYAYYIKDGRGGAYPPFLRELARKVVNGESDRAEVMGQLAFRDLAFLDAADSMEFEGDKVAFKFWQQRIHTVRELQEGHPSFAFGLNAEDVSLTKWLTYIFVHSGFIHFLGNMIFLVIFGAALESLIGGLALLTVFLLSGVMAAGVFAVVTGVTSSPLVGASGAISGIMTLYCLLNWSKPERYLYWLFLPFRGFMGFVFLPAWIALVMWVLTDMAGYLSSLAELGGVAHTAHLGGEVAGALTAVILFLFRKVKPHDVAEEAPLPTGIEPGVLYPFLGRIK